MKRSTFARDIGTTIRVLLLAIGLAVVSFIALVALGSWGARHRDLSTSARYVGRVGQRCVVLKGLRAHGWSLNDNDGVTYEVDVTKLPGIAGPEITFETPIPRGTTFVVTSVRECWNCPFDRISYGLEIPGVPELKPYKVFGRAEVVEAPEASCRRP